MVAIRFEWDDQKAALNRSKHAISFEEVRELFTSGVDYLQIYDVEHSLHEDRFVCIGLIAGGIVVVVVEEADEDVIRIISARRATRRESILLGDFLQGKWR